MATTTKATTEHYRAAAKSLGRALPRLEEALAELFPGEDELPFGARLREAVEEIAEIKGRLAQYASEG